MKRRLPALLLALLLLGIVPTPAREIGRAHV